MNTQIAKSFTAHETLEILKADATEQYILNSITCITGYFIVTVFRGWMETIHIDQDGRSELQIYMCSCWNMNTLKHCLMRKALSSHWTCHNPPAPRHWFHAQRNPIYHNYMDVCLYWSHVSQARLTVSSEIKIDVRVPGMSWGTSTPLWLNGSRVYKPLSVILIDLFPSLSPSF